MNNNIIYTSYNMMWSRHRSEQYFWEEVENNTWVDFIFLAQVKYIKKGKQLTIYPFHSYENTILMQNYEK